MHALGAGPTGKIMGGAYLQWAQDAARPIHLNSGLLEGVSCPAKPAGRADEDTDFARLYSVFDPSGDPCAAGFGLLFGVIGRYRSSGPSR